MRSDVGIATGQQTRTLGTTISVTRADGNDVTVTQIWRFSSSAGGGVRMVAGTAHNLTHAFTVTQILTGWTPPPDACGRT